MRVTIATVNAALQAAGMDAELVRGNHYLYFAGPAMDRAYETAVYTTRVTSMSVDGWVAEAKRLAGGER